MKKISAYECSDGVIIRGEEDAKRHELAYQLSRWHGSEIRKAMNQARGIEFASNLERCSVDEAEVYLKFMESFQQIVADCKKGKKGNVVRLKQVS